MKRLHIRALLFAAICCWLPCPAEGAEVEKFQNGDRICFIGDSITAMGLYSSQVLLFYVTRHPEMRLETFNCGIGGDVATGGVARYAWDIAPHKPTVATIMFGMNDVGRTLYAEGQSGPEVDAQRRTAIEKCLAGEDQLATLLSKDGVKPIFLTPSIFDQTGNQKTPNSPGVNDALGACAEGVRKLAEKHHAGLVDFNAPMNEINSEWQKKDPRFTVVGEDRIHPGSVGNLVMAYLFLKAQGMTPAVATMGIDAASGSILEQDNCKISGVSAKNGGVAFDCLEGSLPFPVASAAEPALKLVPFMEDLNREMLRIPGLGEGDYEVLIDGQTVAKTSASALKSGLNLAAVKETPQYKQAQEVQKLIDARNVIQGGLLRGFVLVERRYLMGLKDRTPETDRKVLEQELEKFRNSEGQYNQFHIRYIERYLSQLPEKESLQREVVDLLKKAYAAARPTAHSYLIRPLN